jgi:hypothetical protein
LLVAVVEVTAACASSGDRGSSSGQEGGNQQQGTTSSEETTSPSPVEAVQLVYKNTTGAKTAKVDMNISFSLPNGASTTTSSSGQQAGMNMNITGQGVVDFENKMADFTAQTPIGEIEARQVSNTIYEKLPDRLTQQKADQKPWIKVDLDSMAKQQFGTDFSGLQGGNAPTDPTQQLGYLKGVSDSVEEVGTEEVRGAPATHYKANTDLEKAAAQQQEEDTQQQGGAQARQAYDQLEQQLRTSTLPVDVWLDDQGRMVRYEMSLAVSVPASSSQYANQQGGSSQGQIELTEELYDYGTPVSVEAPPEDQTSEVTSLTIPAQQKGKGSSS